MVKEITTSRRIKPWRCNIYSKGLVSDNSLAGFGIAICRKNNNLLFQMNGPISGFDITVLEAELTALKRVLTEARRLEIDHISIYCDYDPIYKLVTGRSVLKENKAGLLLRDVKLIRKQFASSYIYSVSEEKIRYAYELAREIIVSEVTIHLDLPGKAKRKESCSICFDDYINADQMFSVEKCRHKFCSECVKQHIKVKLLEENILTCPHYQCKSMLTLAKCDHLLTSKLKEMWRHQIKEASISFEDRVYCPNPRCSALMSKTKLCKDTKGDGVKRSCIECSTPFCINCKVLWHNNLSCNDYIRLHPNPTINDGKLKALANQNLWRQCGRCQHMIERSEGCIRVKCRCGHNFCYLCGAVAGGCPHGHALPPRHGHALPLQLQRQQQEDDKLVLLMFCGFVLVIACIFDYISKHS